ncbi:MAG: hypothetical protein WA441_13320 [Methyloceanibacter sp.]
MPQTTKKRLTPHTLAEVDPVGHARFAKYDDIGNRLRDIAALVGVIYWACAGLSEVVTDECKGIEHLAHTIQEQLEAIAEEVRLMNRITRRTVTTGAIAAVAALPVVGLSKGVEAAIMGKTPRERFEYHARELEKALLDFYPGAKIVRIGDGTGGPEEFNPHVLFFAHEVQS